MAKAKRKYYRAWETVTAVDPFPLTGAIVRALCSCGQISGQPIDGKPEDHQYLIGRRLGHYCLSKTHARKTKP